MTSRARHLGRAGPRLTRGRAAVAVLVAGAAACLAVGVAAATTAPRTPEPGSTRPAATTPAPGALAVDGPDRVLDADLDQGADARARVRPTRIAVPAIDVRTRLVRLGTQPDGTVEVPEDPARAGWFAPGTVPGETGSAVVLGHVDSVDGPAVFARLAELRRGAVVAVAMSDGTRRRFRVQGVRTYANAQFPATRVYRGRPGRRLLTLVTCGGAYDRARGGYQANVVVWTRAV